MKICILGIYEVKMWNLSTNKLNRAIHSSAELTNFSSGCKFLMHSAYNTSRWNINKNIPSTHQIGQFTNRIGNIVDNFHNFSLSRLLTESFLEQNFALVVNFVFQFVKTGRVFQICNIKQTLLIQEKVNYENLLIFKSRKIFIYCWRKSWRSLSNIEMFKSCKNSTDDT